MSDSAKICYCGSGRTFDECCRVYLENKKSPPNAEALMRSRFSAYATENFAYILATYAPLQRSALTIDSLAQNAAQTRWLKLVVHQHLSKGHHAQVEFSAYYQVDGSFYCMHETSDFILQANKWYYSEGLIHRDSGQVVMQRNDPCLCQSGKKYKKCCGL
ncbi:MAG: YchJ family protein [Paraglaciecola sp.]|nr:YchJ family protein [Paraglaciecola sp.]